MSSTSAVAVLAQGLRELRDFAEGPDGEELRQRTGLTTTQIEAALGGERLPTREVTLALVEAWEGDVEAWREYWGQISELAQDDDGEGQAQGAATPAPPEPSIITPREDLDGDAAEREAAGSETEAEAKAEAEAEAEVETETGDEVDAQAEAARARSAARAQLEANAQAAKAHSEAMAAAAEASVRGENADSAQADSAQAAQAEGSAAPETAPAEQKASAQSKSEEQASTQAKPADAAAARADGVEPAESKAAADGQSAADPAESKMAPRPAQGTGEASAHAASGPATVLQPTAVVPGNANARPPAKKSLLARIGVPVLLFAIGVGVGAFGDHALNSKQDSKNTSASVPPVSGTSRPSRPTGSASLSAPTTPSVPSYTASGSSSNPTASATPTNGSTSATSTVAAGTVLGTYVGIQLASGYSVNFLSDPYHPAAGTANGPDTMGFFAGSFVDGRFYADRVAVLDQTDTGSFTSCLNDTRYQHDVLLSQLSTSSSFCITTGTGHLVLVTVRRLPSSTDANPYAVLDVTVWQEN
ncbi:chemotaxis protein histidine kinase CheA [Catenulispora sp. GAS73]|uniref:hypothetical protein n=1 Tax=Catenulispora sp. GAS73 TaxID=3156269 RepID=UPI003519AD23